MDALIVVHTEIGYLDPEDMGSKRVEKNRQLFDGIAGVVGEYLRQGHKAYYLAEASDSPQSPSIYPAIRQHFPTMTFIPYDNTFEEQGLRIKERLREDDPDASYLVGVSYSECLKQLHSLLTGNTRKLRRSEFEDAYQRLGWAESKFERLFPQRMNAVIKEELTDKV